MLRRSTSGMLWFSGHSLLEIHGAKPEMSGSSPSPVAGEGLG